MADDPVDDLVRRTVGGLGAPAGLEARILVSVARRRRARRAAVAAAALVGVAAALVWPRPQPIEPAAAGPVFSLKDPVPSPMEVRGVRFATEVCVTGDLFAVRFLKGGASDE
jgi:hypothetical protein